VNADEKNDQALLPVRLYRYRVTPTREREEVKHLQMADKTLLLRNINRFPEGDYVATILIISVANISFMPVTFDSGATPL
jgi:hypothetical protein